jgi:hypothetical protein
VPALYFGKMAWYPPYLLAIKAFFEPVRAEPGSSGRGDCKEDSYAGDR